MALNNLTGQQIQNTYQKVVQTDGTNLADGTGSILPISFNGDDVIVKGTLKATEYIVSSSVTNVVFQQQSGSTIFGDTTDDTHTFTGNITASGNISSSGDLYAEYLTLSTPGIDIDGSSNGMAVGSSFRVGATLEIEGSINVSGDIIANSGYFDANTLYLGGTSFSKNELDTLKEGKTINTTTKDLGEGDTNKNNIVRPNAIMSPEDSSTYVKFTTAGRVGQFVGGHLYFDQNSVNDTISLGKANSTQLTMTGNITASNNIRAIGDITASGFMGTINGGSW